MPGDQSYRSASSSPPRSSASGEDSERSPSQTNKVYTANVAAGGGNAYAASMAEAPPESESSGPGFFDKMGALMGSAHLKKMLGSQAKGIEWDDGEKGANRMSVDVMGKDEMRVPKLRVASIAREGLSASAVRADDIKVREQDKSKSGAYVAELTAASAGASNLKMATPALEASGIDLNGIKVRREMPEAKNGLSDFFSQPGSTTIEVDSAAVKGFSGVGVNAGSVDAQGVSASVGDGVDFAVRHATGTGVSSTGVNLATADATGIKGHTGAAGLDVGVDALSGTGVKVAGTSADAAQVKDLKYSSVGGPRADVASLDAQNFAAPGTRIQDAHVDQLAWRSGADAHTVTAAGIQGKGVDAGGVKVAAAQVGGARVGVGPQGVDLGAQTLAASGIDAGGAQVQSANAKDASMKVGGGRPLTAGASAVEASGIRASGIGTSGVGVDHARVSSPTLTVDKGTTTMGMQAMSADGIAVGDHVRVDKANATAGTLSVGDGKLAADVGTIGASGVTAGPATFADVSATGGSVRSSKAGVDIGARSMTGSGIAVGGTTVEKASLEGAKVHTTPDKVSGTATSANISGVKGAASARSASATGASFSVAGGATDLGAEKLAVDDLGVGGATVDAVKATDTKLHLEDGGTRASAGSADASGIRAGDVTVKKAGVKGASVSTGKGTTSGNLTSGSASGIRAGSTRVDEASVKDASFVSSGGTTSANAKTLGAKGVTAGDIKAAGVDATGARLSHASTKEGAVTRMGADSLGASNVSAGGLTAGGVSATGVDAALTTGAKGTGVEATAKGGSATKLAWQGGGTSVKADSVSTGPVAASSKGGATTVKSDGLRAQNVTSKLAPAKAAPGPAAAASGGPSVVQQVAGLVDDASVKAEVPMRATTMGEGTGRVTVKEGTTAFVEVKVVDGKVVPAGTSARFDKPLDTWGWTSVPGVYMTEDGKLMASVSGMFDKDLTGMASGALGQKGGQLPLDVKRLAAGASTANASGEGKSTGGASPVDLSQAKLQASVGLNAGTIQSGGVSATLGRGNSAKVGMNGDKELSIAFSKLILDAFGMQAGGATVDVKNVRADNAGASSTAGGTSAQVGSVSTGAASFTVK